MTARHSAPVRLAALAACGLSAAARAGVDGRAIFDAAGCRACHAVGGVGGNAGPDLTLVGARRSREWLGRWLRDPKAWKPDTRMPNFRLKDPERAAIVDYLASLEGRDIQALRDRWDRPAGARLPWTGDPADAAGERIYRLAGCVACHGPQGRGGHPNNNVEGGVIPPLRKVADGYNLEELESRIRQGRKPDPKDPSQPAPLVSMPSWGRVLAENEIDAVARYLLSLAPPKKPGEEF